MSPSNSKTTTFHKARRGATRSKAIDTVNRVADTVELLVIGTIALATDATR